MISPILCLTGDDQKRLLGLDHLLTFLFIWQLMYILVYFFLLLANYIEADTHIHRNRKVA